MTDGITRTIIFENRDLREAFEGVAVWVYDEIYVGVSGLGGGYLRHLGGPGDQSPHGSVVVYVDDLPDLVFGDAIAQRQKEALLGSFVRAYQYLHGQISFIVMCKEFGIKSRGFQVPNSINFNLL